MFATDLKMHDISPLAVQPSAARDPFVNPVEGIRIGVAECENRGVRVYSRFRDLETGFHSRYRADFCCQQLFHSFVRSVGVIGPPCGRHWASVRVFWWRCVIGGDILPAAGDSGRA